MKSGFVAIAGRPNAGKSTLINHLMNQKIAIVSAKPQTTRCEIRGILNHEEGQIVFTDTPGIHKARSRLESRMNQEAGSVIAGVDLIYLVIDGTEPYGSGDAYVLQMVRNAGVPVFLILNKTDRMQKEQILKTLTSWQKRFAFAEFFAISAKKDDSFADLIHTTFQYLPDGDPMYPGDMKTDAPQNFQIAELIREKILYCTEDEVPHSTAVLVEKKEFVKGAWDIMAMILVERDGQKAILIGKQGSMLKKINESARADLENLMHKPVKLSLYVRVEENWRERDALITRYGYGNIDE